MSNPTLGVWKFASCDGCQLSLLDCEDELLAVAGQIDIAYFPEASSGMVEGPYDVSLVEGSDHHAARPRTDPGDPSELGRAHHDRSVRHLRRHPGAPQRGRRQRVHGHRLRPPRVHLDPRHLDPDQRPRRGRLRAPRLPDRPWAAGRDHLGPPGRPAASHSHHQRLRPVQGPREPLHHGRPRDPVPRTRDPRRLQRPVSVVQPRLLRLLRSDGEPEHRGSGRPLRRARPDRRRHRPSFRSYAGWEQPFRDEADRREHP